MSDNKARHRDGEKLPPAGSREPRIKRCTLMLDSALLAVELVLMAVLFVANLAAYLGSGRRINLVVAILLGFGLLVLIAFGP